MNLRRVHVAVDGGYDVVIGHDALAALATHLRERAPHQVALVSSPAVSAFADEVATRIKESTPEVLRIDVPDGEPAKDLGVAERCWQALGTAGVSRTDVVVAVGGGAVTDVAGFVAATWLRGIAVAHVPTTMLGMVDAAVGGKTAINTSAGKNLVGAFHQPSVVVADLAALDPLPQPEYIAGLAEVVKCGFIADPAILDLVERETAAVLGRRVDVVTELIERSIRVKVDVVADDPHESGRREFLNYGHTLAHAIEHDAGYGSWRHGDAVAVGLCYAAAVARRRRFNPLPDHVVERHRSVLELLGLPTRYAADAWPRLRRVMSVDKKTRGARLRFVVLDDIGRPTMLDEPNERLLEAAYEEVSE